MLISYIKRCYLKRREQRLQEDKFWKALDEGRVAINHGLWWQLMTGETYHKGPRTRFDRRVDKWRKEHIPVVYDESVKENCTRLQLNRKASMEYMNRLCADVINVLGDVSYFLLDDSPVIYSHTKCDKDNYAVAVMLGVKELNDVSRFHRVLDKDFVQVVMNFYFEVSMCFLRNRVFREENMDKTTKYMYDLDMRCLHDNHYYLVNYKYNTNAIFAEECSISLTNKYLCETFPDVDNFYLESIIETIVKEKMKNDIYFIHHDEPFQCVDEICMLLNKAYNESFDHN